MKLVFDDINETCTFDDIFKYLNMTALRGNFVFAYLQVPALSSCEAYPKVDYRTEDTCTRPPPGARFRLSFLTGFFLKLGIKKIKNP